MKIGFIGCGNIASYHADVLVDLGHRIQAVTYRSNTRRAQKFAEDYGVGSLFADSDWRRMVQEEALDALWVLPSWDQIDLMFQEVIEAGIPAFFEKPIALNASKIGRVIDKYSNSYLSKYQVGYNRRFYDVAKKARKAVCEEDIIFVSVNIPEPVDRENHHRLDYVIFENSSHVLDLKSFVLDCYNYKDIQVRRVDRLRSGRDYWATYEMNSIPVLLKSIWNIPENFSISIYTESNRIYRLSPLERLSVIEGFDIKEPTKERPIRSYDPKTIYSEYVTDDGFKPGFKEQASRFLKRIVNGGELPRSYFENLQNLTCLCEELSRK
jgi:predicted dehydrogenase